MIKQEEWQAEQLPYPRDADYHGAKGGIFDPDEDAEKIIGKLNAGDTFIYLFRRFGYPRFGWDGLKHLTVYHITTPMPGVLLTVEPDVTGDGTFGYMLREDIDQACMEEEQKPYRDWYRQCEAWVLEKKGIEIIQTFEQDNNKLQRVWKAWAAAHAANDFKDQKEAETAFYEEQATLQIEYTDRYASIHPRPRMPSIENRPDDSIIKQCHTALCDTIRDLLRPVHVRDVMISIKGKVVWDEVLNQDRDAVKCATGSGCGVGDKMEV